MGNPASVVRHTADETARVIPVAPAIVFAVLADGWSYADWVVGSTAVRAVDPAWPAAGAHIRHRVGRWPLRISDVTVVRAMVRDQLLELEARLRLFGRLTVRIMLAGDEDGTTVYMAEQALCGPFLLVPEWLRAWAFRVRNRISLARLADLAVRRVRDEPIQD